MFPRATTHLRFITRNQLNEVVFVFILMLCLSCVHFHLESTLFLAYVSTVVKNNLSCQNPFSSSKSVKRHFRLCILMLDLSICSFIRPPKPNYVLFLCFNFLNYLYPTGFLLSGDDEDDDDTYFCVFVSPSLFVTRGAKKYL